MKIGIITNLYPPYARGGAEVVITRTVTELLAQGHEVFIVTSRPFKGMKSLFPCLEDRNTAAVYRFFPLNIYHTLQDYRFASPIRFIWHIIDTLNPFNALVVRRVVRKEQPDVVITHNLKGIGMTIPVGLRTLNIPRVHQLHDVQLVVPSGLVIAGQERPKCCIRIGRNIYAAICRSMFGSPDLVISPSRFLERFYKKYKFFPESDFRVVPNPAPKMDYVTRDDRPSGPIRLLFVGQLEPHKGIKFLIESLEHFEMPCELTVAGEGTLTKWVEEKARTSSNITYAGFISMSQMLRLFQMADALVVPSLCYENSPTVIYEALQAGLPVLAADIGGVAELIQEGKNGFLFRPADSDDLLETLRMLDRAKNRFREQSEEVRGTVFEHQINRYALRLVEMIKDLVR